MAGHSAWMIEGCLQWQRYGLAPPAVRTAATATYLEAEDAIAAWMQNAARSTRTTGRDAMTCL